MAEIQESIEQQYYWGVPDSPIDWCENNYEISPFICEFYNTFSSFIISFFALYGIYLLTSISMSRDEYTTQHIKIVKQVGIRAKVLLSYSSLAVVGVGSAFYHATLLYKNQLFDEFPMIVTASLFIYCLLTMEPVSKSDSKYYQIFRWLLPYALVTYFLIVSTTIFIIRNVPTILQVSFGVLIVSNVIISTLHVRGLNQDYSVSNQKKLLTYCTVSMLIAYFSWLAERKLCNEYGYVIPGLQLHAVWHALTGLAGFYWVQFYICSILEKNQYKTNIIWNWGVASINGYFKSS
ncbi:hypothetical protein CYY_001728 [Polysphondylium violaceum]|uniref:Alkaline dihydroceramidase n=1 Tax=Polysphondylium violaceum TaxID=133409 RepID=A0A8J4V7L3_9MYCE|nr:hypothetical protein CYY_001728 [Polysphondylium violaceum]